MSNNFDGSILVDQQDTTAILNYIGFGRTGFSDESNGPRIGVVNIDPTSIGVAAPLGTLAIRYDTAQVWQKVGAGNADWSLLGSSTAGAGNSFVWVGPLATQTGNIYNNWDDLYAALSSVAGIKTVYCVATGGTLTMTDVGGTQDLSGVQFIAIGAAQVPVEVDDGVVWSILHLPTFEGIELTFLTETVSVVATADPADSAVLSFKDCLIDCVPAGVATATPFDFTTGSAFLIYLETSELVGSNPIMTSGAGKGISTFASAGSRLRDGFATGAGTIQQYSLDPGVANSTAPGTAGILTLLPLSRAENISYNREIQAGSPTQSLDTPYYELDTTAAPRTLTLLDAAFWVGKVIVVKQTNGTNTLTIQPTAGDNIDGAGAGVALVLGAGAQHCVQLMATSGNNIRIIASF